MSSTVAYLFVLAVGLAAGALSGIIGTGSSIILLPTLVFQFGPKQAVPIMAIAALMANVGKVLARSPAFRRQLSARGRCSSCRRASSTSRSVSGLRTVESSARSGH
jgi:hypothetical protein